MNNSYYIFADSGTRKRRPLSILLFYLREVRRFSPLFFACLFLQPLPEQCMSLLSALLPARLVAGLSSKTPLPQLLGELIAIGAGLVLSGAASRALSSILHNCASFFDYYLARRFLSHMKEVDYEQIGHSSFRDIYSSVWNTANNARGFYQGVSFLPELLVCLIALFLYGTLIGRRSLLLLLLVLGSVALDLALLGRARKVHKEHYGEASGLAKGLSYIARFSEDSTAGKDIRLFHMADFILSRYDRSLKRLNAIYTRIHNRYLARNLVGSVLIFARSAFACLLFLRALGEGRMDAAEFVFLLGAMHLLASYFDRLLRLFMSWNTLDASVGSFMAYLEAKSHWRAKSALPGGALANMKSSLTLTLSHVSYTYEGAEGPAVNDVSFTLHAGEKLALIGLNGAGKSTLVKLICGLLTPDTGSITINGYDRSLFTAQEYTSLICAMFQDSTLLPLSLDENLTISKEGENRLAAALSLSGFDAVYRSLPSGGKTPLVRSLQEGAADFSGGERQKLLFARALCRKAPLMLLDEPTAALDPIAEEHLYTHFAEAVGKSSAIYISHRLASTRFCDRILLLENGALLEEGTHESLLAAGGRYAALYAMQSKYYREGAKEGEESA